MRDRFHHNRAPAAGGGRRGGRTIGAILAALAVFSALAVVLDVDRSVAGLFFDPARGWPVGEGALWQWLYHYGTIPGLALTLAALVGVAGSFRIPWLARCRRELLVVFLTAVIGGGVLVNAFFKPHWGRPRPRQVALYGGQYEYRPFYRPGIPGKGQSFPCGHCTMGFVFVSLAVFRRRAPAIALAGTGFGFVYGGLLGLCRIVQGAHFTTDVLWSLGIMSLTAAALHYLVLPDRDRLEIGRGRPKQRLLTAAAAVAMVIVVLAFLTRRPVFEVHTEAVPVEDRVRRIDVVVDGPLESRRVRFEKSSALRIEIRAQGFGWSMSRVSFEVARRQEEGTLAIHLQTKKNGYFSEFNQQLSVTAPEGYENRLSVRAEKP